MEVIVVYNGALAYYSVVRDRDNIYNAYLTMYQQEDSPPPASLTLVRSIRHWTGSVEDAELLYELGRAIERQQQPDVLFPPGMNHKTIMDNLV